MSKPQESVAMGRVTRRSFLKSAGLGSLSLAGGLSWAGLNRIAAGAARPVKIGAINHLTGSLSTIGIDEFRGMELAVKESNEAGGVLGREVVLISADDAGKPANAVEKATRLVEQDQVDVLIGVVSTSVSIALQEFIKERKVIFINGGSGSDTIMEPPNNSRYFFHAKWDNTQVTVAVKYIAQKFGDGSRWFFVGSDYAWGHDSVTKMKQQARSVANIQEVGTEFAPLGTTNFTPIISRIAGASPDVVALALPGADYSAIVRQIRLFGIQAHLHHDYASTIEAAGAGDAAIGLTGGVDFAIDYAGAPSAARFAERFHAEYGAWPSWTAGGGATAVQTYLQAVAHAGGTNPDDVIEALETLTFEDTVKGPIWYRKCDHQAIVPIHVAEIVRHPVRGFGLKVLHTYEPREVESFMRECP